MSHTDSDLKKAVHDALAGTKASEIANLSGIPVRILRMWVANAKKGITEPKRRGPAPLLPAEAEIALRDWIVGRQIVRKPASRSDILRKAREVSEVVAGQTIGHGWYARFMTRHPGLVARGSRPSQELAMVLSTLIYGSYSTR